MSELNKITIDGIEYDLPSGGGEGTTVIPNPEDEADDSLHKIKIGEDTYKIENVPMFTGTKQEYEEVLSKGEIPEGCIVNITDDFTPGGGTDLGLSIVDGKLCMTYEEE